MSLWCLWTQKSFLSKNRPVQRYFQWMFPFDASCQSSSFSYPPCFSSKSCGSESWYAMWSDWVWAPHGSVLDSPLKSNWHWQASRICSYYPWSCFRARYCPCNAFCWEFPIFEGCFGLEPRGANLATSHPWLGTSMGSSFAWLSPHHVFCSLPQRCGSWAGRSRDRYRPWTGACRKFDASLAQYTARKSHLAASNFSVVSALFD